MKATRIMQRSDGGVQVMISDARRDEAAGRVVPYQGTSAPNYGANTMADQRLIPEDLRARACAGWGKIDCATAEEATAVAARIEDSFLAVGRELRMARASRVREYVCALIQAGKPLYVRGQDGAFIEIS